MPRKAGNEFGELILDFLRRNAWPPYRLAERSGMSGHVLMQLIQGDQKPEPRTVDMLAHGLNLDDMDTTALHRAGARTRGWKV